MYVKSTFYVALHEYKIWLKPLNIKLHLVTSEHITSSYRPITDNLFHKHKYF